MLQCLRALVILFALEYVADAQVAYWPFDDARAPTTDTVAGMTGSAVGVAPSVNTNSMAPVAGNTAAMQFNGSGYLSVPHNPLVQLAPGSPMSILIWLCPTGASVPNIFHVYGKRGGSCTTIEYQLARDSRGLHFTAGQTMVFLSGDLPMNTWSHVAITWSGDQGGPGSFTLYLNGQIASRMDNVPTLAQPLSVPLEIGSSGACANNFVGLLDELRYYDRELTQAEIAAIASSPGLFTPFGQGCPGSVGTPRLSANGTLPQLGRTYALRVDNVPPAAGLVVGCMGLSMSINNNGLGSYTLPHDLGSIGMTGCSQLVSVDVTSLLTGSGSPVWLMPIPNAVQLVGVVTYHQAFVPDFGINPMGATVTQAGTSVIGS